MLPSTARENNFPPAGLSRTYTTNSLVPDSAATAFSMYSGVKTNFYTMGYDSNIQVTGAKHCAYPACVIAVPRVEGGAGISPVVKIALITNCPCVLRAVNEPLRSFSVPGEGAY